MATFVKEFQSPSFRSETVLCYMVVLFLALGVCGLMLARGRITEVLWITFFAYCSLQAVRHVPLFLIVATPIVAEELSAWWSAWAGTCRRGSPARIVDDIATQFGQETARWSLWIPVTVVALCVSGGLAWPSDFPSELFPARIVANNRDLIARSRIYCSDQWSDYLIYQNYPRQRVFMDDRHQYYSLPVRNDYLVLAGGNEGWKQILDRYRVDAALCPVKAPLTALLRGQADWRVVEEDDLAVLLVRN